MKKTTLLKTMLLLCALVVGSGSLWAEEETLVFNTDAGLTALGISKPSSGSGTNLGDNTYVQGDVSLSATDGTTETRVWNKSGATTFRVYSTGTFTISVPSGKEISNIVFAGTTNISANVGTWTSGTQTWSGSAQSVTFTNASTQSQIETIEVTYGAADPRTVVDINSLTFSASYVAVDGATVQATAGHNTPSCTTATFTYESLDTDKATCTPAGVITAVANGTARIKATMSIPNDDPNYRVGTATITQTIEVKKAFHTASFYVNGVVSSSNSFEEDAAVTFPSDPAGLGGKVFMGWKKGSGIPGTTDVAPSLVTKATETMDDDDVDYYAVYATSASATVTKTDELTLSTTGVSGSSYSAWSGKSATDGSAAVYSGCNAGGNSSIQLNASTNTSKRGIISTTSGGKLKKVTITWNSNTTNGRSVTVYGSNSAYTTMSDFDSSKGTELGSITKNSSTELSITGNYTYVGFYATQAIYMDKISIDWETTGTTYSAYCTDVTTSVEVSNYGWATYITPDNVQFADGDAFVVTEVNTSTGATTLAAVETAPADTPVLLKGKGTKTITVLNDNQDAPASTLLEVYDGSDKGSKVPYVLAKNGESAGFKKWTGSAATITGRVVMWLDSEITEAREFFYLDGEGDVTGIAEVNNKKTFGGEFYNLNGQKVQNPSKGLYIVNGKKVIVK